MSRRFGTVAVVGAPNAGKSTLVNALVGQKVAIVSPKAQTTRTRLMGIAIAVPIVVSGSADVLALPEAWHFNQWVGLVVLAVVGWLLYRSGAKPEKQVSTT